MAGVEHLAKRVDVSPAESERRNRQLGDITTGKAQGGWNYLEQTESTAYRGVNGFVLVRQSVNHLLGQQGAAAVLEIALGGSPRPMNTITSEVWQSAQLGFNPGKAGRPGVQHRIFS
jgi:hypothetical protein